MVRGAAANTCSLRVQAGCVSVVSLEFCGQPSFLLPLVFPRLVWRPERRSTARRSTTRGIDWRSILTRPTRSLKAGSSSEPPPQRRDVPDSVLHGEGLAIFLPGAPPMVKSLDVHALKRRLDSGDITVIDVRSARDRAIAPFAGADVLEPDTHERLTALPKDTPLAFICHHGNSSRQAAEHFRGLGFHDLYNVEGGIDAWAEQVDPSVPRY